MIICAGRDRWAADQSGRHVEEAVGGAERQLSAAGYSAWQLRRRRRQQVEDHVDDARQIQTGRETENDVFKRQRRMDGVGGLLWLLSHAEEDATAF